jgi:PAS domain S-box-containing protein
MQAPHIPVSIVSYSSTGRLLTVDDLFTTLFGFTQEEAVGAYFHELILTTPYREAFIALLSSYIRTGKPEPNKILWHLQGRNKDGETFPITQVQCTAGEENEKIFISNIQKTQIDECSLSFDIRGSILLCSSKMAQDFFGEKQLMGKKIVDLVPSLQPQPPADGSPPNYLYLMEGMEEGERKSMHVTLAKDNKNMVLQFATATVGFNMTIFNATFQAINPFEEVVILADSCDQIVACNSQVFPILGYKEEELQGKHLNVLLPEVIDVDSLEQIEEKHLDKRAKLLSIWRDDSVAKVMEVQHNNGMTMMVICYSLSFDHEHLSVILRKVIGTDLPPEIQVIGKYSIGQLIATGNYGKVKKAVHIESREKVAVKIINKKLMTTRSNPRYARDRNS